MTACLLCQPSVLTEFRPQETSPDGRYFIVVDRELSSDVLVIRDSSSGKQRTRVRLGGCYSSPVFSPDSRFISFYVHVGNMAVLTVTDLSGHSWPVAKVRTSVGHPAWSADSRFLFFSSGHARGGPEHYRVTAGGTELTKLTQVIQKSPAFH